MMKVTATWVVWLLIVFVFLIEKRYEQVALVAKIYSLDTLTVLDQDNW